MSTPIYQLAVIKNNISMWQAYNALSEEERNDLTGKMNASTENVGGKTILACYSAWADEEHPYWNLLYFPSVEARIQQTLKLQEIGWLQGVDAFTLMGTSESEPLEVTIPNPIYKLWVTRASPAVNQYVSQFSQEEIKMYEKEVYSISQDVGAVQVIQCDSYWCNEDFPSFGVIAYPSIEADMEHMKALEKLGWKRAFNAFTLLGTPSEMTG